MPDPGLTRPDLRSIPAADAEAEPARAIRGGLSADGRPPAGDDPPAPLTNGSDRAIRLSTTAAVLAVAGIAAYVSYRHAYAVVRAHGETGITARLEPATIDGLVYASSMVVLYAARHRLPVPSLVRWLLALGIAATPPRTWPRAGPTVPSGRSSRPGPRSASWARTNFWSGSSAPAGRQTACRQPGTCAPVQPTVLRPVLSRPQPPTASAPEGASATPQTWRGPAGQAAGPSPIPADGQRDDEAREASAVNDAAVAAYRLSVQAGNPLSERRLAQMFGRTSRRWARARFAEARQASPLPDSPRIPATAYP